jgi:hypothetical protein
MAKIAVVLIRALRPFAPLLTPLAIVLGTFVGVVKTAVFFQKTWNQLLDLLPGEAFKGQGGGDRCRCWPTRDSLRREPRRRRSYTAILAVAAAAAGSP